MLAGLVGMEVRASLALENYSIHNLSIISDISARARVPVRSGGFLHSLHVGMSRNVAGISTVSLLVEDVADGVFWKVRAACGRAVAMAVLRPSIWTLASVELVFAVAQCPGFATCSCPSS